MAGKGQPGAPTKLTEDLIRQLDAIVDYQWSVADACIKVGIHPATGHRYKVQGEQDIESGATDTPHARFCEVIARVGQKRREEAGGVLRAVMSDDAAKGSDRVNAAGTILRLDSASRVELSGPDGTPIQVQHAVDQWGESIKRMIEADGKV